MLLEGKIAIVTGASRGIGNAIASRFAKEGAEVILVSRGGPDLDRASHEIHAATGRGIGFACDVRQSQQVDALAGEVLRKFGGIDILVNDAGILGPVGRLDENPWMGWVEAVKVNLFGTAGFMRAVLPHMIARRGGSIINLSGGGGVTPRPRFTAYAASKAAVIRLTETVAEEVAEFQVRVNAIAPGAVNTRMLDQVLEAGDKAGAEFADARNRKQSGGASPDCAADLAVFLASDAAAKITGRVISAVWDDWKSLPERLEKNPEPSLFTMRRIDDRNFFARQ